VESGRKIEGNWSKINLKIWSLEFFEGSAKCAVLRILFDEKQITFSI